MSLPQAETIEPVTPAARQIGTLLREARDARGLTIKECAVALRIKPEFLNALENNQSHLLPTATHAKGFLRSYAFLLGLGAQWPQLQALFQAETQNLQQPLRLHMPTALPEARLPTRRVLIGCALAALLLVILYTSLSSTPAPEPVPAPPAMAETPATPVTPPATSEPITTTAPATPTPAPETPAPAATNGLMIRAIDDVWVQIQDAGGVTIFSRLLRPQEEIAAPTGDKNTLTVGNGAGVVLVLNGVATPPVGDKAVVVRAISLNPKDVARQLKNKPSANKSKPSNE